MTFVSGTEKPMEASGSAGPVETRPASHGRGWYMLALLYIAVAATIGALLRLIYVVEMPWLVFKPWLHAHSHVAMLGWVFPALIIAIMGQDDRPLPRGFSLWMGLSQALVAGMLFSFPVEGYGETSIACSLGQMIVGYILIGQAWNHTRRWPASGSRLLVRLAFIFQFVSTLGVWAMVFLAITILGASLILGKKMGALFRA